MLAVVQRVLKAVVAGVGAGFTAYWGVAPDGVTAGEWAKVVGAVLGLALVTWAVPNKRAAA